MGSDATSWNWRDGLPEDCPPSEATPPDSPFYRIAKTDPPARDDFAPIYYKSRRYAERAILRRRDITPCTVRGLSVFSDLDRARKQIEQTPNLGKYIMRLDLQADDGHILSFRRDPIHHTFWPHDGFDPIAASAIATTVGVEDET